jgi:glutaredoxin
MALTNKMIIKMYSGSWCPDCVTAKKWLDDKKIKFEYIDITKNLIDEEFVKKINLGKKLFRHLLLMIKFILTQV